ncbi:major capsid protein [Methylobacterium nigriterrae]|uniref:major capsid protein n=1 Tax=Methylobacterium nigriterrae TaxID=3127512 RepID=UPI0030137E71
MPLIADVFNGDAFNAVELTSAVNVVPNTYGRLQELDLMPGEGAPTTSVAVQFVNGELNLLPTRARGGPPSLGTKEKRNIRSFEIPHIPHDDFVLAKDVQNVVSLGGNVLENVQDMVNRKLATMRRKHAITLEFLRMGALSGQILDADGSLIYDLFAEFGVTQKTINFDFAGTKPGIAGKCRQVTGYLEDNLLGDVMTSVHALCSPEFFDSVVSDKDVQDAYKYFSSSPQANPLRDDVRRMFPFQGIMFEEYRGSATQLAEDGSKVRRRFIPAGEARFFPRGTTETFSTYFAPGDFMDVVNTPGLEVYARQAMDLEFWRWVKLHTQSNPLPLCKRPSLLVRGTSAA